jgi:D-amino-acid oxidase
MMTLSGTDEGDDEVCYIMARAGGGETILGGTNVKGSWESQADLNVANRIMKRAVELCPQLTGGKGVEGLSVVRHGVGLRPFREGGVRIEREKIGEPGVWVVHNYGHAGWGYQGSYATAERAVELVDEVLSGKSKL